MGDHDVLRPDDGEDEKSICRIRIHPYYANHHITDDLALLELCTPVDFSPEIQPIAIANPEIKVRFGEETEEEKPEEEKPEEEALLDVPEDLEAAIAAQADEVVVDGVQPVNEENALHDDPVESTEQKDTNKPVMVAGWGTQREGGNTARKLRWNIFAK